MSKQALKIARRVKDRMQKRRSVLVAIAQLADGLEATVSYSVIADEAGVCRKTAVNAVNHFIEIGALKRQDNGRTKCSAFTLVEPQTRVKTARVNYPSEGEPARVKIKLAYNKERARTHTRAEGNPDGCHRELADGNHREQFSGPAPRETTEPGRARNSDGGEVSAQMAKIIPLPRRARRYPPIEPACGWDEANPPPLTDERELDLVPNTNFKIKGLKYA